MNRILIEYGRHDVAYKMITQTAYPSWFYEWILGIQRDEEIPGYAHFYLRPQIFGFHFAKGTIDTSFGEIESGWEKMRIIYYTHAGYR